MESGDRVKVDYTPPAQPFSDLARLTEFMTNEFAKETIAIAEMQREAWQYPDRRLLHALGGRALAFRQLLGHFEPIAKALYEGQLAGNLLTERAVEGNKRSVEEVKIQARRHLSDLKIAVDQISNERDQMKEIIFWARAQFQNMVMEEMTGEAAGIPDAPVSERFRFPPAGKGLDKLRA
jgi:hypothetical protein